MSDNITITGTIDNAAFDEWYTRAVEESGFTHDSLHAGLPTADNPGKLSWFDAYVIKQNGKRLEPEEIISRLQRLAEMAKNERRRTCTGRY